MWKETNELFEELSLDILGGLDLSDTQKEDAEERLEEFNKDLSHLIQDFEQDFKESIETLVNEFVYTYEVLANMRYILESMSLKKPTKDLDALTINVQDLMLKARQMIKQHRDKKEN